MSDQFLSSLTSTNWFNETIDKGRYSEDYELVCPYFRMGCKESCRRSTLEKHLKEDCYVAQQMRVMDAANLTGGGGGDMSPPLDPSATGGGDKGKGDESTPLQASTDRDSYSDYEIVCPYAFMGCTFTCRRTVLHR